MQSQHHIMSYADAAARGAKQSPEEAAAPQPPKIISTESTSSASLIDVNTPSVHTVNSDFLEQDVQTITQAERRKREEEEAADARESSSNNNNNNKKKTKKRRTSKAGEAGSWLVRQVSHMSAENANALMMVNLAGVLGLASVLGYKAWGLYEKNQLSWQNVSAGVGLLATVGAMEALVGHQLGKNKGRSS